MPGDPIQQLLRQRGDELLRRYDAWAASEKESPMTVGFERALIQDEMNWLVELAEALELDAIDRRCRDLAAKLKR